ncbi:uncharacterized protein LOC123674970 [Harmonia axyridis]|uniref:uncharacterized protein LOC123674970 n=1 Tax=Harmonia axyridis TaxID=115357 RepID=UPI001E27661D|nr:uncharacterized protein LOC123674970 [Harmonia axyridis]
MATKAALPVFDGEASETESEESIHISFYEDNIAVDVNDEVQCLEINGEDSESGDEKASVSSISTTSTITTAKEPIELKSNNRSQSLLHHKLRESNSIFYNDLEDLIKDFVKDNKKSLGEIDHHISKSQTILQGASPSLKNFNCQSVALKNKLETLLSSNFLSNVKVFK